MSRKLRPTKSAQRINHKLIGLMLEVIEQGIEQYKKLIETKNKQTFDLKNILKAAKNSYQEVTKGNKQLKQYIKNIK